MKLIVLSNPPSRWRDAVVEYLEEVPSVHLQVYEDQTREIISHNDSPDLGFRFSVNPYRGCFHACAYCYARPTHEFLSFGAGTDFDRKIVVKPRADELLRDAFNRPSWKGDLVLLSGNTDCYQPLEASYRLTRACLEVCRDYRNPVHIITKSPLIERDLDLLVELRERTRVGVTMSIPFWDAANARAIEPYVATPERRMRTAERLAASGIEVSINIAPIIPGLNDVDIPAILEHAAAASVRSAAMTLVRLNGAVAEVFEERIRAVLPLKAERILHRIREVHGGKLTESRFGVRHTGEGEYARAISALFDQTARRLGIHRATMSPDLAPSPFERPTRQLSLFPVTAPVKAPA